MKKFKRPIEPAWILKGYHEATTLNTPWRLSDKLFKLDLISSAFTLEMAFRGLKIFGSTGSGKTSGIGRIIGSSYLEHGFGGLVLCTKADNDELDNWQNLATVTSRTRSIIHFGLKNKESEYCFDILEFLRCLNTHSHVEFQTNIVALLKQITNNFSDQKLSNSDGFWDGLTEQYLTHLVTVTLCLIKTDKLTFQVLHDVFNSINNNLGLDSILSDFNEQISVNRDLQLAYHFFEKEFKNLNEKTSSIVITAISSMLFKFNIGALKKLFGGSGNINPSWIMGGAVIIVNMPSEEYGDIGKVCNQLWKFAFQKAVQNRKHLDGLLRPIFLWADEAQEHIHANDAKFQATARSKWCSTVYLTQNRPGLRLSLGSGSAAEDALKTLDANLVNSIFLQNSDEDTNNYASKLFGKKEVKIVSKSYSGFLKLKETINESFRDEYIVKNEEFISLKNGGKKNNFKVDSYVSFPGVFLKYDFQLHKSLHHKKITIDQRYFYNYLIKNKYVFDVDFIGFINTNLTRNKEGLNETKSASSEEV